MRQLKFMKLPSRRSSLFLYSFKIVNKQPIVVQYTPRMISVCSCGKFNSLLQMSRRWWCCKSHETMTVRVTGGGISSPPSLHHPYSSQGCIGVQCTCFMFYLGHRPLKCSVSTGVTSSNLTERFKRPIQW